VWVSPTSITETQAKMNADERAEFQLTDEQRTLLRLLIDDAKTHNASHVADWLKGWWDGAEGLPDDPELLT
jgi:hypothetical protein